MKPPVFEEMQKFKAKVWDYEGDKPIEKEIVYVDKSGACIDINRMHWCNYKLIQEPKFRKFSDRDEFIQWLRDTGRTDMRVIDENGDVFSILPISAMSRFEEIIKYKWFDNGEPVGVK
jgi:hypothetical protein